MIADELRDMQKQPEYISLSKGTVFTSKLLVKKLKEDGQYFMVLANPEKQEIQILMSHDTFGVAEGRGDFIPLELHRLKSYYSRLIKAGMFPGVYLHYGKGLFRHINVI